MATEAPMEWIFLFLNLFHHTTSNDTVQTKWLVCQLDGVDLVS